MARYYFDDVVPSSNAKIGGDVAHFEGPGGHRIGLCRSTEGEWCMYSRGEVIDRNPQFEDVVVKARAIWGLTGKPSKKLWVDL